MAGLEANKKHIMELFREWDAEFFPATQDTGLGATKKTTNEGNTSFADALKEIDEDSEDSDEQNAEEANAETRAGADEHQVEDEGADRGTMAEGTSEQHVDDGRKELDGEGEAAGGT